MFTFVHDRVLECALGDIYQDLHELEVFLLHPSSRYPLAKKNKPDHSIFYIKRIKILKTSFF